MGAKMSIDIEQTYKTYYPMIRAKCMRMLSNSQEAEDVAQDTFVRLWRSDLSFQDHRQVIVWIYKTSTHLAIDRIRQHQRIHRRDDQYAKVCAQFEKDTEDQLIAKQSMQRLAKHMTERDLAVAILARLDGMNQQDVGALTGMSSRNVRRILSQFDTQLLAFKQESHQ